jgi:integrase
VASFHRHETGTASIIRIGDELERVLCGLPVTGPLFPKLKPRREAHRATDFNRTCRRLKIKGVTFHSYRYSWAERAEWAAYPGRYAQEALGHHTKAVMRLLEKCAGDYSGTRGLREKTDGVHIRNRHRKAQLQLNSFIKKVDEFYDFYDSTAFCIFLGTFASQNPNALVAPLKLSRQRIGRIGLIDDSQRESR